VISLIKAVLPVVRTESILQSSDFHFDYGKFKYLYMPSFWQVCVYTAWWIVVDSQHWSVLCVLVIAFDLAVTAVVDNAFPRDIGHVCDDLHSLAVIQIPEYLPLFQNKQWRAAILANV